MKAGVSEIGAELAKSFNDAADHDLLTNWMARYLAEKLSREKQARGAEKAKLGQECAELIIKLWEHRHALPDGVRPFESFEPIFQALQELSSANPRNAYARAAPRVKAPKEISEIVEMAGNIDQAANSLIRYLLSLAVQAIPQKDKRWVKLRAALRPHPWDFEVVYVLAGEADKQLDEKTKLKAAEIKEIERMLAAVQRLQGLSLEFVAHFQRRLETAKKS